MLVVVTPRNSAPRKPGPATDQAGTRRVKSRKGAGSETPNDGDALRLFCFPYAGGGTTVFHRWPEGLSGPVKVHAVELPGRGRKFAADPARRMDDLVDAVIDSINPHLANPFSFFGHSLGALVAFEVARAVRARLDVEPVALYVSAHPGPQVPNDQPPLHALSDPELRAELRRVGGTPQEVLANDEFMRLLLPTLRADFEVSDTYTYTPGAPLSCPIVAWGGVDDPQVSQEDLQAWAEQTTGPFAFAMLPGGHFFIDHNRRELLAALDTSVTLWH